MSAFSSDYALLGEARELLLLRQGREQRNDAEPAGEVVSWCPARNERRRIERRGRDSLSPSQFERRSSRVNVMTIWLCIDLPDY